MHFFTTIDRREMLAQLARIYSLGIAGSAFEVFTPGDKKQYKISACDWSIGKRNDPAAIEGIAFGSETFLITTKSGGIIYGILLSNGAVITAVDAYGRQYMIDEKEILAKQ